MSGCSFQKVWSIQTRVLQTRYQTMVSATAHFSHSHVEEVESDAVEAFAVSVCGQGW